MRKQEPDGYDIEVAKLLGTYMGVKVNLVPLTSPNRIPFLITNKVDLIVATLRHHAGAGQDGAVLHSRTVPRSRTWCSRPKGKAIGGHGRT